MPRIRPLQTLGGRIERRRKHLGLSVAEAARRAGVTRTTWHAWEKDTSIPDDRNHRLIEDFCEWEPGSVVAVLEGRASTPLMRATVTQLHPGVAHAPPEDVQVKELREDLIDMKIPDALVDFLVAKYIAEQNHDDITRKQRYLDIARAARG